MKEKVVRHINNCLRYVVYSPKSDKGRALAAYLKKIFRSKLYGPVDDPFVVVDGFTKYVRLNAKKTTIKKEFILALEIRKRRQHIHRRLQA